jgi:RNA polymerase sigma factor (sigma-70 family)
VFVHSRAKRRLQWPAVLDDDVATDRRLDRQLVLEVHPRTFETELLHLEPGEKQSRYPSALRELLSKFPDPQAEIWEVAKTAKWNVPSLEYGDPNKESRDAVYATALGLVKPIMVELQKGSLATTELLQREIEMARAEGDLSKLAAWLKLLIRGSEAVHQMVREIQVSVLADLQSQTGSLPRTVEQALHEQALHEGEGLHQLFYQPHPEFCNDSWLWEGREQSKAVLKSPLLVGIARYQLGRQWWDELLSAFACADSARIEGVLQRCRQLNAALAEWRLVGARHPVLGDLEDHVRFQEDAFLPDDLEFEPVEAAYYEMPGIAVDALAACEEPEGDATHVGFDDEIRAALLQALSPREWEVLRRTEIEGELAKDVATSLGISTGRVSQLRSAAKKKLKDHPELRALWAKLSSDC